MYIIIKKDKASHFSKKLEAMKDVVCDLIECLEEAKSYNGHDSKYHDDDEYEREHHIGYDRERRENKRYDREDDDEGMSNVRRMTPHYAMRRRY